MGSDNNQCGHELFLSNKDFCKAAGEIYSAAFALLLSEFIRLALSAVAAQLFLKNSTVLKKQTRESKTAETSGKRVLADSMGT
ncbi:hypothetical protein HMPREF1862_01955 [Varibaculum cambriense]|uniref:Uncharacterized protein n=1 Tax=Varibaculum cambriense TaxID=184870 RepID=A0AB34WWS8_9ACTO|nr:hypothetical protein HMPREF1862_01955 [Varibaculum cambriense]